MKKKPRLTVILGAGSLLDLDFPSTQYLTEQLKLKDELWNTIKIIMSLKTNFNFEDIIYTIEYLYRLGQTFNLFGKNNFFYNKLVESIQLVSEKVIDSINNYKQNHSKYSWYPEFWNKLSNHFNLDIISLNYDNLFEKIIFKNRISNGFTGIMSNEYEKIDYSGFYCYNQDSFYNLNARDEQNDLKPVPHRIMRLHGCVNFYTSLDLPVNLSLNKSHPEANNLLWYEKESTSTSCSHPHGKFEDREYCYSKDGKLYTSIITGHNKINKNKPKPYKSYFDNISLMINNSIGLLIVGYAFNENDVHLNGKLFQCNKNKIVIIDFEKDSNKQIEKRKEYSEKLKINFEINENLFFNNFKKSTLCIDQMIKYFCHLCTSSSVSA